jgi:hypothetical protein
MLWEGDTADTSEAGKSHVIVILRPSRIFTGPLPFVTMFSWEEGVYRGATNVGKK